MEKEYYDNHYAEMKVQPIDIMQDIYNEQEMCDIFMSQVIKYHLRAGHKQGEAYDKDIAKRDRYLSWVDHLRRGGKRVDANLDYPLDDSFKEFMLKKIDEAYEKRLATAKYD